jgi:hypothetical protein
LRNPSWFCRRHSSISLALACTDFNWLLWLESRLQRSQWAEYFKTAPDLITAEQLRQYFTAAGAAHLRAHTPSLRFLASTHVRNVGGVAFP